MGLLYARCYVLNVELREKGHFILTVQHNKPFKTNFLKFYLRDDSKLKVDEKTVTEGDAVIIEYHYDTHFPVLDDIWFEHMTFHDECPRCHAYLQGQLAQRMDPGAECCNYIPCEDHRNHIDKELKLVTKSVDKYKYSLGMELKFSDDETGDVYHTLIYENSPVFHNYSGIEILNKYRVIGWKEKNNYIELVEIK